MRIQPSAVNSSLVRRVVVPVAEAQRRALARGHARTAGRRDVGVGVGVEQPHVHLGDHAARGAQPLLLRVVGRRADSAPVSLRAVELQHARAGALLELARALVRHHLAAGEQDAQRRQVVRVERRRVQHHHELRRHRGEHGDAVALDRGAARPRPRSARSTTHGAPDDRGREVRGPQAEAERRGQRAEEHVVGREVRDPVARSSWNANQRAWLCITIFGSPVVPDVELRNQSSSAPIGRSAPGSPRAAARR